MNDLRWPAPIRKRQAPKGKLEIGRTEKISLEKQFTQNAWHRLACPQPALSPVRHQTFHFSGAGLDPWPQRWVTECTSAGAITSAP